MDPTTILDVKMEIDDKSIDNVVSASMIDQDSMVSCGRCEENMSYEEYKNKHRHKHYNLCWLDGEKKLDYSDLSNIVTLLREILPKNAERNKKVSFTCEWCKDNKRSVVGYASHVKKCAPEQKVLSPCKEEPIGKTLDLNIQNLDSMVTCGSCEKSMTLTEYEEKHKSTHYNLCWLNSEEKPDFDNENVTIHLLKQTLPKYAAVHKKINFSCEWCKCVKKSVSGFANHIKKCKLRPDKICLLNETTSINNTSTKFDVEIAKDKLESIVTCGRCNTEMTFKEYCYEHCSTHYNLCWIDGEEKPDFDNYDVVISKLKECIPFSAARRRNVSLTCEYCKTVKKSIVGFASHIIFCNKNPDDVSSLLIKCKDCGCKVKPSTFGVHKTKCCKDLNKTEKKKDLIKSRFRSHDNSGSFQKLRRKKRPPNVLTFHPDTKHASEYYDCLCRLCDYIASRVDDILNHILTVHSININNINNDFNLNDYIINTYDLHKDMYLKPLLNYYNFSKKIFWTAYYHEDFQCDTVLLNSNDAMKYLPSVQQSCTIFNSDDEQISIDLFKSIYIDGFYWLFTGGPIWTMSWCPVPHEVQTQYLAISCHPKPDIVHKQMTIYKYPSLVQLWTFNSLNNINNKSICDMPYMCYGLAHEFGAVWDMAWCPSGAYEPNKKIGLLALSTSSGDCPIFAMPCVCGDSEMFYIYKAKSMIARNFQCKWNEIGIQCTKVCWKTVPPFNTVICGYSNGMVSVFNINFKSIFFNNDVLYPSHTFRASKCNITGLSMNYFNTSILATTSTDGNVILWDLNSTKNPVFKRKCYCPSNCDWLQQCYVLLYCTKGVNPLFTKVRTINFSNYDNDVSGYNPELYILKNVANSTKVISNYVVNNDKTLSSCNADETMNGSDINMDETSTTLNDFNIDSDDDSLKSVEQSENSDEEKSEDPLKNIDDDDLFGPSFFQSSIHWSISGSNWMNIIATCNENGVIYEKLFLPETNQIPKENSTTFQLMIKKLLSNDTPKSSYSNGYRFKETVEEFGLKSRTISSNESEQIQNNPQDDKPLLRYPLDNITKVSWNQNFCSFRWLAIGTQSGFALVSPSQSISDDCIESFYKIVSTPILNNSDCQT